MAKVINTVIKLRYDQDYNYQRVGNTFIPAKGEVCLVNTSNSGLRALVGDGQKTYNQLDYVDYIFFKGYFDGKVFWKEEEFVNELEKNINKIYIALNSNNDLYIYNGENYEKLYNLPYANSKTAGVVKLYDEVGNNTDGSMTQRAITEELEKKVETSIEGETIFFIN